MSQDATVRWQEEQRRREYQRALERVGSSPIVRIIEAPGRVELPPPIDPRPQRTPARGCYGCGCSLEVHTGTVRYWRLGMSTPDTKVGACCHCTSCVEFKPQGMTRSDWAAYLGMHPWELDKMLRDDAAKEE